MANRRGGRASEAWVAVAMEEVGSVGVVKGVAATEVGGMVGHMEEEEAVQALGWE